MPILRQRVATARRPVLAVAFLLHVTIGLACVLGPSAVDEGTVAGQLAASSGAGTRAPAGRGAVAAAASAAGIAPAPPLLGDGSPLPPPPTTPAFPSSIDPPARYEVEDTCSPTAKPGALVLVRLLEQTYGTSIVNNIVRACSSELTGHKEGRAIDWMTNSRNSAQRADAESFINWLLAPDAYGNSFAMARRLGVMYLIWDGRIYGLYNPVRGWAEYNHCLTTYTDRSYDTTCHRNHVHISMSWDGAMERTSYYTMAGGAPRCTLSTAAERLPAGLATGPAVELDPTTVLDTVQGIGTPRPALPCATAAGSVLAAPLAEAAGGPLPADTVSATVQVTLTASMPTWVQPVLPAGPTVTTGAPLGRQHAGDGHSAVARGPRTAAEQSIGSRISVSSGTASGTWVVPVGPSGSLSLQLGPYAGDVQVVVLGYARAAGPRASTTVPVAPPSLSGSRRL